MLGLCEGRFLWLTPRLAYSLKPFETPEIISVVERRGFRLGRYLDQGIQEALCGCTKASCLLNLSQAASVMTPDKNKKPLPYSTSVYLENPRTPEQWRFALQLVKMMYLKSLWNQCSQRCGQLLLEPQTRVRGAIIPRIMNLTDNRKSPILCRLPILISIQRCRVMP